MKGKTMVGVGLQYGDEGKIKVFDKVAAEFDLWARFNGGANSGHHLRVGDFHIVTHSVPSFFTRDGVLGYSGSGELINPLKVNAELAEIASHGITLEERYFISSKCSLVQPHHTLLDGIKGKEVGTTGNGIGPAYADQASRQLGTRLKNVRFGDYLTNQQECYEHVKANLEELIETHNLEGINVNEVVQEFDRSTKELEKYHCQDPLFLEKLIQQGKNIFFEGGNAVMLDVITGDVPYVTSSRTIAAAAYTGGDLSVRHHAKTIGVAKAVMSRVGNGPFIAEFGGERSEEYCKAGGGYKYVREVEQKLYSPQELLKSDDPFEIGIGLRMLGFEYGATTKRPRRIGMLDLVMLRQNCVMNGVDELYINKFDCLREYSHTSMPGIPLVTAYELDGENIDYIPTTVEQARKARPVVEYIPAFSEDISGVKEAKDLPKEVRQLAERIESEVGTPLHGIGVGPEREQFVWLK